MLSIIKLQVIVLHAQEVLPLQLETRLHHVLSALIMKLLQLMPVQLALGLPKLELLLGLCLIVEFFSKLLPLHVL